MLIWLQSLINNLKRCLYFEKNVNKTQESLTHIQQGPLQVKKNSL